MPVAEPPAIEIAHVPVVPPAAEDDTAIISNVSLLGGPLQNAGRRLGLVRGPNTVGLGIAIGGGLWIALTIIATIEGKAPFLFAPDLLAFHLRLLIVIPLFFLGETLFDPRLRRFVTASIQPGGLVGRSERPALTKTVVTLDRITDSWMPDTVALIVAVLSIFVIGGAAHFAEPAVGSGRVPFYGTVAGFLHMVVGMSVFRFLLLRWMFRFALWTWFLWRFSRLKLQLVAVHPDRSGGLGLLELVQVQLMPLVVAFSILVSGTLAEELFDGSVVFSLLYPVAAIVAIVAVILVFGPMLVFVPPLLACRLSGLVSYMGLASRYVGEFQRKWVDSRAHDDQLLGTADLQSLADLSNSVNIAQQMRMVPAGTQLLMSTAIAAVAPLAPLLLFRYSVNELVLKLAAKVLGG